jgi:hypothetical protein
LWSEDYRAEDSNDQDVVTRVQDFCEAIRQTYSTTPDRERALRQAIASEAVDRFKRLSTYECFVDLLAEVADFNKDIVGDLGSLLQQEVVRACATCGKRQTRLPCPCSAPTGYGGWGLGRWEWVELHQTAVDEGGVWGETGIHSNGW